MKSQIGKVFSILVIADRTSMYYFGRSSFDSKSCNRGEHQFQIFLVNRSKQKVNKQKVDHANQHKHFVPLGSDRTVPSIDAFNSGHFNETVGAVHPDRV